MTLKHKKEQFTNAQGQVVEFIKLYVEINVNGKPVELTLKPNDSLSKDLIVNELTKFSK